ncbi:MAG: endonuclease domain-containing protein [Desulfuromonadales bacterium]
MVAFDLDFASRTKEQPMLLYNRPPLKSRRKELRNGSTPAEIKLWSMLQHSNLGGYKFRRQHSVGFYILDFYCPSVRLAVELDGDSHFTDDAIEYDRERTAYLNALNIKVVRFLNTDVYENLNGVCEKILEEIKGVNITTPQPPP